MSWTPQRIAKLRKLCDEGLSCSQIAARLGDVSRNAVIGKISRLGINKEAAPSIPGPRKIFASPVRRVFEKPNVRPVQSSTNATSLAALVRRVADNSFLKASEIGSKPVPPGLHLTLLDRAPGMCCFPVGGHGADTLYCCAAIEVDRQYCDHHQQAMKGRASSPERIAKAKLMREAKARDMKRRAA
jgi:GcrA cell cycle regulator